MMKVSAAGMAENLEMNAREAGKKRIVLEICVDSVASAVAAWHGGADRLELCQDLALGGTTPMESLYAVVREAVPLPIHVLIRPRPGDFCYAPEEYAVILKAVERYRTLGAEGIVFGCLKPDGSFHREQMQGIIDVAADMALVCHRAMDMCRDRKEALEELIRLGVGTVLTSGGMPDVESGLDALRELQKQACGRIGIMPGGGLNAGVLECLAPMLNAPFYHMSAKRAIPSAMRWRNPAVSMGSSSADEYTVWQTDEEEVRRAREVLDRT